MFKRDVLFTFKHVSMRALPRKLNHLFRLAARTESGARTHAAAIGLPLNTAEHIHDDLVRAGGLPDDGTPSSRTTLLQARTELLRLRGVRRDALAAARTFCTSTIDRLKPILGRTWNVRWEAVGLANRSLAVPRSRPYETVLLLGMFLRAHPEYEIPAMGMTADQATIVGDALMSATSAVDTARRVRIDASQSREYYVERLRKRLTAVRTELDLLLAPDDNRWVEFGFGRPTDLRRPEPVAEVTADPSTSGQVALHWDRPRRARHYRVRWRRADDPEGSWQETPGRFRDPAAVLREMPSGETIVVEVVARNRSGDARAIETTLAVP